MSDRAPTVQHLNRPDGVDLAWELWDRGHARLAVVTHGILGYRTMPDLAPLRMALLAAGWDVLLWDVRGHGDSGGRFSFGRLEWQDLDALVTAVETHRADRAVAAVGFSFGAFHSVLAAAFAGTFDRLALVSGPKDFRGLPRAWTAGGLAQTFHYRFHRPWRRARLGSPFGTPVFPVDVIDRVSPRPVLVVHGTRDVTVPVQHAHALYAAARAPKALRILEGGLHAEYLLDQMPGPFLGVLLPWLDAPADDRSAAPEAGPPAASP